MKNARKGFTLIEVVIVAAISMVILFGVFNILQISNEQLETIHAKMTLQEGSREALFKMAQEIRQTSHDEITDFGSGNSLRGDTINFRVPVPDPDELTLRDGSYVPVYAADINYSLVGGQIIRTSEEAGVTKEAVLANNITALAFSRSSAISPLVTIQISAQLTLPGGRTIPDEPVLLTMQAQARNP